MRPAHNDEGVTVLPASSVSLKDLSASVWLWHRNNGAWDLKKVIEIPAERGRPGEAPALLKILSRAAAGNGPSISP